jgi:hypothetical protein
MDRRRTLLAGFAGLLGTVLSAGGAQACDDSVDDSSDGIGCDVGMDDSDKPDEQSRHPKWSSYFQDKNPLDDQRYRPPYWGWDKQQR